MTRQKHKQTKKHTKKQDFDSTKSAINMYYLKFLLFQLALFSSVRLVVEIAKENDEWHSIGKDSNGVSSWKGTVNGQIVAAVH